MTKQEAINISSNSNQQSHFLAVVDKHLQETNRCLGELDGKAGQKNERDRCYLQRKAVNLRAFQSLTVGQSVGREDRTGTVYDLTITPGGKPEVLILWDDHTVPVPEQPELLRFPDQSSVIKSYDTANSFSRIGRDVSAQLKHSNVEARSPRRSAYREHKRFSEPAQETDRAASAKYSRFEALELSSRKFAQRAKSFARAIRASTKPQKPNLKKAPSRTSVFPVVRENVADIVRTLPLEEVAERLGLERDRRDKHKWRSEAHSISITGQRFYDWYAERGSGGAIDFVMHVQGWTFKEAVDWLGRVSCTTIVTRTVCTPKRLKKRPVCNIRYSAYWSDVKHYLTQQRGIPDFIIDVLKQQGLVDADVRRNAMFFRHQVEGDWHHGAAEGAILRGTRGNFKGLTPGTNREAGYFWFRLGDSQPKRLVMTESPIDALSAAALAQKQETIFLSTDGAGALPIDALEQFIKQGREVILAQDRDRAGEYQAWTVASKLVRVQRALPNSKDWNDQLLKKPLSYSTNANQWHRVAQALGRSEEYLTYINDVLAEDSALSPQAGKSLNSDFQVYWETSNTLWQWYQKALSSEKTNLDLLDTIIQMALGYHASAHPTPLSTEALSFIYKSILI